MNYLVEGKTHRGFPIIEIFNKRSHAVEYCRELGINPNIGIVETKDSVYVCEHCGIYFGRSPKCNKCEIDI